MHSWHESSHTEYKKPILPWIPYNHNVHEIPASNNMVVKETEVELEKLIERKRPLSAYNFYQVLQKKFYHEEDFSWGSLYLEVSLFFFLVLYLGRQLVWGRINW